MALQNPPGFNFATRRSVWIPSDPCRPYADVGGQAYDIDLSEFFDISDETVDELLTKIPAYHHTLRWFAWVTSNMLKVIEGRLLAQHQRFSGESKTHVTSYVLPADPDWANWKAQKEWLDSAVESCRMQMEVLRTFSANRRPEGQAHFHPAVR